MGSGNRAEGGGRVRRAHVDVGDASAVGGADGSETEGDRCGASGPPASMGRRLASILSHHRPVIRTVVSGHVTFPSHMGHCVGTRPISSLPYLSQTLRKVDWNIKNVTPLILLCQLLPPPSCGKLHTFFLSIFHPRP